MRIRTLKPAFWSHHMHETVSETAAMVAIGLLNYADDAGRFLAAPRGIECALFPIRKPKKSIAKCLKELAAVGFIMLYAGEVDGRPVALAWIPGFLDHQVINKPTPSRLPAPPQLPSDSGSPTDSGQEASKQEGKGREGKGEEGRNPPPPQPAAAVVVDPPRDELDPFSTPNPPRAAIPPKPTFMDWKGRYRAHMAMDSTRGASDADWAALFNEHGYDDMCAAADFLVADLKDGHRIWPDMFARLAVKA